MGQLLKIKDKLLTNLIVFFTNIGINLAPETKLLDKKEVNFGRFLPSGPALLNFIKILSLVNTQPNRPRASPAIFKHVGQVPYSRGFKFGEKGPIKILAHFCLQVRCC